MFRCNRKIPVLLLVAILATAGLAIGNDAVAGTIKGRVVDQAANSPIAGAWVAIVETNQGATTDSLGWFVIKNVQAGNYTLILTHREYGTVKGLASMRVSLSTGQVASTKIVLSAQAEGRGGDEEKLDYSASLTAPFSRQDRFSDILSDELMQEAEVSREKTRVEGSAGCGYSNESPRSVGHRVSPCPPVPSINYCEPSYELPPQDMFFRDYGTNGFVDTQRDRFSTFAADVDDASYTIVRRYLQEGNVPPQDAVRVEEFINHFDYGYNPPRRDKFRIFTELTDSPFERNVGYLKIGIKGREIAEHQRSPLHLTLVVDVSGSMRQGGRMELVKESLRMLVDRLDRRDRVGIVAYNSNSWIVLSPVRADQRQRIFRGINSLQPGGSTNAEAGLMTGYQMANGQFDSAAGNLVILCSDGVANVGNTGPDGIMNRVARFADDGITLSSFGFGMGNYNDVLLEQLAQRGNGRYAYVNDREEARRVCSENFVENTQLLARDVKIQVEFNPQVVKSYRLVGYENRDVADHRFRDNTQDGGEIGMGHEVTALYEVVWKRKRRIGHAGTVFVRWTNTDQTEATEVRREINGSGGFERFDNSRPELRLAITAARFAGMLKGTFEVSPRAYQRLRQIA